MRQKFYLYAQAILNSVTIYEINFLRSYEQIVFFIN